MFAFFDSALLFCLGLLGFMLAMVSVVILLRLCGIDLDE